MSTPPRHDRFPVWDRPWAVAVSCVAIAMGALAIAGAIWAVVMSRTVQYGIFLAMGGLIVGALGAGILFPAIGYVRHRRKPQFVAAMVYVGLTVALVGWYLWTVLT